jgi:hypothetical protein
VLQSVWRDEDIGAALRSHQDRALDEHTDFEVTLMSIATHVPLKETSGGEGIRTLASDLGRVEDRNFGHPFVDALAHGLMGRQSVIAAQPREGNRSRAHERRGKKGRTALCTRAHGLLQNIEKYHFSAQSIRGQTPSVFGSFSGYEFGKSNALSPTQAPDHVGPLQCPLLGLILPAESHFHLETATKLLKLLERVLTDFS